MKILVVSDEESKYIWDYFDPEPFRGVELIISCGDLDSRYLSFIATMIPAPVLYVHGNHDKTYLRRPPEGCISIDDTVYTHKGVRILGLGGCRSANTGPFEFTEKEMKRRLKRRFWDLRKSKGIDLLVTHSPALGLGDREDEYHTGFETFLEIIDKYRPKYHFYGHVHSYGKQTGDLVRGNTTLVKICGYKILEI